MKNAIFFFLSWKKSSNSLADLSPPSVCKQGLDGKAFCLHRWRHPYLHEDCMLGNNVMGHEATADQTSYGYALSTVHALNPYTMRKIDK